MIIKNKISTKMSQLKHTICIYNTQGVLDVSPLKHVSLVMSCAPCSMYFQLQIMHASQVRCITCGFVTSYNVSGWQIYDQKTFIRIRTRIAHAEVRGLLALRAMPHVPIEYIRILLSLSVIPASHGLPKQ